MKTLFTILIAVLCSTLLGIKAPASEFPDISVDTLEELIKSGEVVLVDVNGSKYFAKGHIPGAIDFRAHEEEIATVLGENQSVPIVVYCGSPSCEAYEAAAIMIRDAGYTNIRHLSAGISGWIGAGKETARLDQ
ncbi:MAG: rhodanese-like domain-containing protein [Verrucomicrobiales bacterium]|nr:rhodanese-like domain-containing protein [Verrucomicrobiales bacterium]